MLLNQKGKLLLEQVKRRLKVMVYNEQISCQTKFKHQSPVTMMCCNLTTAATWLSQLG